MIWIFARCFGVILQATSPTSNCGKLGEFKGSFALLEAMHRLKRAGLRSDLLYSRTVRRRCSDDFGYAHANSASWTAYFRYRFYPTGACRNSFAVAWPYAVSNRIFRSRFTRRSFRARCCCAEGA
jgi:hypothetical protein